MVKVACGAEWDFGFNMLRAMRGRGVNFATAETVVNFVDGGADIFGTVEACLVESELLIRFALKLI